MAKKTSIFFEGKANFSQVEKAVKELSGTIGDVFKSGGAQLFDEETVSLLKGEAEHGVAKIVEQMKKLKDEGKALEKTLAAGNLDSVKQNTLLASRMKNVQQIVRLEKQLSDLRKQDQRLSSALVPEIIPPEVERNLPATRQSTGLTAQAGKTALSVASQVPIVGHAIDIGEAAVHGAQKAPEGSGAMGALGFGALGAAAVAAGLAISHMTEAARMFEATVGTQLKLEAFGGKGKTGLGMAAQLGFSPEETMQTQLALTKALGSANTKTTQNRMENVMLAARRFGMAPEEIAGEANQLRAVGGTEKANKQLAAIISSAMTSGMDKSQASHYIQASTQLLAELNKNGMSDSDKLLSVMTELTGKNAMSPEQAARTLGGMSNAIAGSTGENNVFFQMAAARAGLGGGTIFGTQAAVAQGLNRADLGALSKINAGTFKGSEIIEDLKATGIGDRDFTQKFSKGVMDQLKNLFGTGENRGSRGAMLSMVGQLFGTNNAMEQARDLAILDKLSKGGMANKQEQKVLESLGNTPEENWRQDVRTQLATIAGNTAKSQAGQQLAEFNLGEKSMTAMNALRDSLTLLDTDIVKILGGQNPFASFTDDFKDTIKGIGITIKEDFNAVVSEIEKPFDNLIDFFSHFGENLGSAVHDAIFGKTPQGQPATAGAAIPGADTPLAGPLGMLMGGGGALSALAGWLSPNDAAAAKASMTPAQAATSAKGGISTSTQSAPGTKPANDDLLQEQRKMNQHLQNISNKLSNPNTRSGR